MNRFSCATNDIHVPRFPNERFRGKSGMGYRGDAILQFDWTVGQVLDALEELGLTENTLVILTSDNGPVVDDGYKDRAVELLGEHRPWGPYRGSKYSNFEAGTRVPFVVSWPGKVKKGVSSALISQIDFLGTMAEMLGVTLNEEQKKDSEGYLKSWLGKSKKGRDYVVESAGSLSVSDGEWKYITPNNKRAFNANTSVETGNFPSDQLYNLKKDMGEKHNVAEQYPQKVQKLKDILKSEREKR
jgi:arylsulfatase A-like enzyme